MIGENQESTNFGVSLCFLDSRVSEEFALPPFVNVSALIRTIAGKRDDLAEQRVQ